MEEAAKSEIQLHSIFLLSTLFNRGNYLDQPSTDNRKLNIDINLSSRKQFLDVKLTVKIGDDEDELDEFYVKVIMIGIFERKKETAFSDEEFGRINAAAIIYPYIRQHIRGVSLDAGLSPIILPLVNFQKLYEHSMSN